MGRSENVNCNKAPYQLIFLRLFHSINFVIKICFLQQNDAICEFSTKMALNTQDWIGKRLQILAERPLSCRRIYLSSKHQSEDNFVAVTIQ